MKIVCVYGDDEIKARDRYVQILDALRKRGWEHISLDPSKKISEQLVGSSLFETERIYTLEKPQKLSPKEYDWIKTNSTNFDGSLLIYFVGSIPANIRKFLPKDTKLEEYKLQKKLFVFLESVSPGNKSSIKLFHEVIKTDPVELVLALLARHLKDLYILKVSPESTNFPDWRKKKLVQQLSKFDGNRLENFIKGLLDADVKSKSGEGDLTLLLDLLLLKI